MLTAHNNKESKELAAPVAEEKRPKRKALNSHKYQALYPDQPLVKEYVKEFAGQTVAQVIERERFQEQFTSLLNAYKKWGTKNGCSSQTQLNQIDDFKTRIFLGSYTGSQSNEYFNNVKKNLEEIWFIFNFDEKIPKKKKQEMFKYLCEAIQMCAPGLYTHVEDILASLTTEISLGQWLAELRTNIIRCYAEKHVQERQIQINSSIHVYNALLSYAINEGLEPLSSVDKMTDPFTTAFVQIDDAVLINFSKYFKEEYTQKAIVNCIATNFISELNKRLKALSLKEEKPGWWPATSEALKLATELSKVIYIPEMDFFDLTDDSLFMHFNPQLFQLSFQKVFQKDKELFRQVNWQRLSFAEGYVAYADGREVLWLEDSASHAITWEQFPEETLKSFFTQLAWYKVSLNNIINTPLDLAKYINHRNEQRAGFLSHETVNKILNSDLALREMVEALVKHNHGSAEEKVSRVLSLCKKKFLIDSVSSGDLVTLNYLLTETSLSPCVLDEDHNNLAHVAVRNGKDGILEYLGDKYLNLLMLRNKKKETPAEIAATQGQGDVIRVLTKFISLAESEISFSIVIKAIDGNHPDVIKALLEDKIDLNFKDKSPLPIVKAVSWGRTEIVALLAEAKADLHSLYERIDLHFNNQKVSLPSIAAYHGHLSVIKQLAEYKVNMSQAAVEGNRPIIVAARQGHADIVKELVKHIDVTSLDSQGESPIFEAIRHKNINVVEVLVESKADLRIVLDGSGMSPAHAALVCITDTVLQRKIFQLFAQQQVDFHQPNASGETPLQTGCRLKAWEAVNVMMNLAPRLPEHKQAESYWIAAQQGNLPALKILLDNIDLPKVLRSSFICSNNPEYSRAHVYFLMALEDLSRVQLALRQVWGYLSDELTETFIQIVAELKNESDKREMLSNVAFNRNALGFILNTNKESTCETVTRALLTVPRIMKHGIFAFMGTPQSKQMAKINRYFDPILNKKQNPELEQKAVVPARNP